MFFFVYSVYSKWEQQEWKEKLSQKLKLLTETFIELRVRETPDVYDEIPS
jgi:hypothetical protein